MTEQKMWRYKGVRVTPEGEYKTGERKEECDRRHPDGDNCPGYHYRNIYADIDDLGELGWELVTVIARGSDPDDHWDDHWTAFFKRPKITEPEGEGNGV